MPGGSTSKAVDKFKPPPDPSELRPRPRKKVKVLDEDEYVAKVEKIVERDFFPELEKLKARSQYIDAADRNDTAEMRRLQERFSTGRIPTDAIRSRLSTPSTFETPINRKNDHDDEKPPSEDDKGDTASVAESKDGTGSVSLDAFLQAHTSEDNESFNELMAETRANFERTHAWMFKKEEQLSVEDKRIQLDVPSIEDQSAGARIEVSRPLDSWTYKNENAVFYPPAGAELTPGEKVELAKKQRSVVLENTRFQSNPWKSEDLKAAAMVGKAANKVGKVGIDGKDLVDPKATPSVGGHKLLRLDDPSPMFDAADASPFMTWGEVESTPYRLEGCDDPIPVNTGGGPSFKMQQVPKRDRLALELAEKNSKFYRDKKGKAIEKARAHVRTPKSMSMRVASMSPAAQRLATSKLGVRLGTDKMLKAAYTPSPASSRRSTTPAALAGAIKRPSTASGTPKTAQKTPRADKTVDKVTEDPSTLTDDLLKLPAVSGTKRPLASDFL